MRGWGLQQGKGDMCQGPTAQGRFAAAAPSALHTCLPHFCLSSVELLPARRSCCCAGLYLNWAFRLLLYCHVQLVPLDKSKMRGIVNTRRMMMQVCARCDRQSLLAAL